MIQTNYEYEYLNTREGFNNALGHFKTVSSILGGFEASNNLADLLNEYINDKTINQNQIPPIIHALLVDKYQYKYRTVNMAETFSDFSKLSGEVQSWKGVDIILVYIHPELGYLTINPKNPIHFESLDSLRKQEAITIYAGKMSTPSDETCNQAIKLILDLLSGKKVNVPDALKRGKYGYKKPEPAKAPVQKKTSKTKAAKPQAEKPSVKAKPEVVKSVTAPVSSAPKKMTPFYSVQVTNELFHNGNVEAWKRIIQSYTTKHPGLEVYIFYDKERIHDINTLFKWGKVKHGSSILFAVAGDNIADVAKLQRYLSQGASPRFEDFLRFPVNSILKLF